MVESERNQGATWPRWYTQGCFLLLILVCISPRVSGDDASNEISWIADAHVHHGPVTDNAGFVFDRIDYFENGNVRLLGYPLPVSREKTDDLSSVIRAEIQDLQRLALNDERIDIAIKPSDINKSLVAEKWALIPAIEYFHGVFGGDPSTVESYAGMGIRYITLIDNEVDPFFINGELSPFGQALIGKMNEEGILIDISHLSEMEALQVIRSSGKPVIASHACATAVSGNPAGLSDPVLDSLAHNKGFVFTTFNKNDLIGSASNSGSGIDQIVNQILYLVEKLGHGHVGIGSDYQAFGRYVPADLNEANTFSRIEAGLLAKGFSAKQIDLISHGAFIRAFGQFH